MRRFSKATIAVVAGLAVIAAGPVQADESTGTESAKPEGRREKAERRLRTEARHSDPLVVEMMGKRLDLTDEQQAKVEAIVKEAREKAREAVKADMESVRKEIDEVLTEEQRAKAKEGRERADKMRERAKEMGETARHRMALRTLDLTEEQREKIKEIEKASREKMEAIQEEVKPKLDALRKEAEESIKGILTEEQRKELEKKASELPPMRRPGHPGGEMGKGRRQAGPGGPGAGRGGEFGRPGGFERRGPGGPRPGGPRAEGGPGPEGPRPDGPGAGGERERGPRFEIRERLRAEGFLDDFDFDLNMPEFEIALGEFERMDLDESNPFAGPPEPGFGPEGFGPEGRARIERFEQRFEFGPESFGPERPRGPRGPEGPRGPGHGDSQGFDGPGPEPMGYGRGRAPQPPMPPPPPDAEGAEERPE